MITAAQAIDIRTRCLGKLPRAASTATFEMRYVIQREDGMFVARSGSEHSYTRDILKAQLWKSHQEADTNRCANERVISMQDLFPEGL